MKRKGKIKAENLINKIAERIKGRRKIVKGEYIYKLNTVYFQNILTKKVKWCVSFYC